jgi:hypothetical protein
MGKALHIKEALQTALSDCSTVAIHAFVTVIGPAT